MRYAYNPADQLIQITYLSGRTVDYSRDALGRIETVTTTRGGQTVTLASNIGYEPFGPMDTLDYGNGLNRDNEYDLAYRVTAMLDAGGSTVLDRSYGYDPADNITGITDNRDSTRTQSFLYDALNRLTDASGVSGALGYTYDANGNRLSRSENSTLETYSYAADAHHLLARDDGSTTQAYNYDAAGNTVDNSDVDNSDYQFVYGDHNRLQQVRIGGSPVADYTYNGRGERVQKVGLLATYYHYDEQGQLLAETDATGTTTREYVYLNGQPLALIANGGIHTIHTDHLGTPQVLTDTNQTIVWEADYEPFGNVNITTEAVTNNLRFPGQYFDEETGLHYNYFRDYDPSIGRYIQSDPIGLEGGNNTYSYVHSNPLVGLDPFGLVKWTGSQVMLSGGAHYGGTTSIFFLSSEGDDCNCEKSNVHAVVWASGIGRVSGLGIDSSSVSLEDNEECPDPYSLQGKYIQGWAGATVITWSAGPSELVLGEAVSFDPLSGGATTNKGIRLSLGLVFGRSLLISSTSN